METSPVGSDGDGILVMVDGYTMVFPEIFDLSQVGMGYPEVRVEFNGFFQVNFRPAIQRSGLSSTAFFR